MTRKALLVGINQYPLQPLAFCVNDARAVKQVLEQKEYGFDCALLEDDQATTRKIKESIERVLKESTDIALFYFAGHGVATDYGAFFVSADCKDREDEGFDFALFLRMVQSITAPTCGVVVLLDCCQSGAFHLGHGAVSVALSADDLTPYLQSFSDRRALIAACKENQLAREDSNLAHGAFTFHLLEGLKGGASTDSGQVTVNSLYDSIALAFEKKATQRPVYRGDLGGRIVLGSGLIPNAARKAIDELDGIERLAEEHLQTLQSHVAKVVIDRALWHAEGFKTACKFCAPIIDWFEKQKRQHPTILQRPKFVLCEQELMAKVRMLSHVEPGMRAEFGLIKNLIGSGSFGSVWRVEDAGKSIAVKVYHSSELGVKEKTSRFRHGFNAMRKLEHPRIVRVKNIYECPLSFSMEFVEGANLRDWVGTIDDPQELVLLLSKITDTLRHAHYRDIVHRDVKPENIIMAYDQASSSWEPFLTDFDLAWFSTASVQTQDALGTVFYAAPEQHGKPGSASARSPLVDVYSLGQVFFFATTRSDPTPMELADNVRAMSERLKQWDSGRAAELMVALYKDCTERDPNKRPQNIEVIAGRLFEILAVLNQRDPLAPLSEVEFAREVRFAVVGLTKEFEDYAFDSPARMARVNLEFKDNYLSIRFKVNRIPLVDNIGEFEQGRKILNQRLDQVVKSVSNCWRKSGGSSPYEVFINVSALSLSYSGVGEIRKLIVKCLGELERG